MYTVRRDLQPSRNSPHPHATREDAIDRDIGKDAQQNRECPTFRQLSQNAKRPEAVRFNTTKEKKREVRYKPAHIDELTAHP